jgi:uncharacterized protein (TIGR03437 family)
MRILLLLAAAAPLFGQCTYSVTPTAAVNISSGSTNVGTVSVTTQNNCAWTYSTAATWLSFTFGPNNRQGSGSGSFGWAADRNPTGNARTGVISVANQTVTIVQAGQTCSSAAVGETSASVATSGGRGVFQIKTNCSWKATSNASWITVSGEGDVDGTINYTVAPNTCVADRTGVITAGTVQYQILQYGAAGNLTLSPLTATIGSAGGSGTVGIATGTGCAWTAVSSADWLTLAAAGGSGPFSLTYRAASNTGAQRTGIIRIGPQGFTLTQDAVPGPTMRISAIVNAASYAAPPVAPGEIVAIYGTAIGPSTLVRPQLTTDGKSLTKLLGGTRVLFDDTPAAMIYTLDTQVSAVAPYDVSGKTTVNVTVEYNGVRSAAFPVTVAASAPAIFTLDQSGKNAGAILNQDYSVNGTSNPAARGSVIQIFCTGAGVTLPASVDGELTGTPLPELTLPVSVLIGGAEAKILYKGGAPGSVAGLTQINAEVPLGIATGDAVAVRIRIGDRETQDGVTVSVR